MNCLSIYSGVDPQTAIVSTTTMTTATTRTTRAKETGGIQSGASQILVGFRDLESKRWPMHCEPGLTWDAAKRILCNKSGAMPRAWAGARFGGTLSARPTNQCYKQVFPLKARTPQGVHYVFGETNAERPYKAQEVKRKGRKKSFRAFSREERSASADTEPRKRATLAHSCCIDASCCKFEIHIYIYISPNLHCMVSQQKHLGDERGCAVKQGIGMSCVGMVCGCHLGLWHATTKVLNPKP